MALGAQAPQLGILVVLANREILELAVNCLDRLKLIDSSRMHTLLLV
jgi:hypothetical protein